MVFLPFHLIFFLQSMNWESISWMYTLWVVLCFSYFIIEVMFCSSFFWNLDYSGIGKYSPFCPIFLYNGIWFALSNVDWSIKFVTFVVSWKKIELVLRKIYFLLSFLLFPLALFNLVLDWKFSVLDQFFEISYLQLCILDQFFEIS